MNWHFTEEAKKKLLCGELNLKKNGPQGIGVRVESCSKDGATIIVDIENPDGHIYATLEPVYVPKGCSLNIQKISDLFNVEFR